MNWNAYTFHGKSLLNAQKEEENYYKYKLLYNTHKTFETHV